jgi:hypothetical protein
MRRELAIKYAHEVARRVHRLNGIVCTPECSFCAVVIRRVWVFGSVAKGSLTPNDLDLLIDLREVGRGRRWCRGQKFDKRVWRSYGYRIRPDSRHQALVWLTRGMRHVSRHLVGVEQAPIDVKCLIYPRWELQ